MKNLPIFVAIKDKPVLVIGGGDVAVRKIQTLLRTEAKVTVISMAFCEQLKAINNPNLALVEGAYDAPDLASYWLIIAATDNDEVNHKVYRDAIAARVLVNVVDDPVHCQFIFPSIVDRSPLVVAISTGGAAPVLGRLWREQLEKLIPMWTGKLASIAESYREQVKQTFSKMKSRRYVWEKVFRGAPSVFAAKQDWPQVQKSIESIIEQQTTDLEHSQLCYVATGPNDPELLTIKALQQMQLADVIIHNDDIDENILNLCRKDADYFCFPSNQGMDHQGLIDEIHKQMAEGVLVCRLVKDIDSLTQASAEQAQITQRYDVEKVPGVKVEI